MYCGHYVAGQVLLKPQAQAEVSKPGFGGPDIF